MNKLKKFISNISIITFSFLFIFLIIEIILRLGFFEFHSTIWISPQSYEVRYSIQDDLFKRAKKNEKDGYFFFNDESRRVLM